MVQENLTEENLAKCRNVIYSLIKMESKGDQLPVPIQTTANNKTKTLKKEEQYKVYIIFISVYSEIRNTREYIEFLTLIVIFNKNR